MSTERRALTARGAQRDGTRKRDRTAMVAQRGEPVEELRETVRERADDVALLLTELASVLVDEHDVEQMLQLVVDLAIRTIPGCDAAGITLIGPGGPHTAVHTDAETLGVDTAQYRIGDGPCLDAYENRRITWVNLNAAIDRWPAFAGAATSAGFTSFLAAPLVIRGEALGALNLYGRSPSANFDAVDETFVELLAGQAAAAIANTSRYANMRALAGQLEQALASRAVIDQAKGILMARHAIDADAAFDLLRRESQHRNVKLREVAAQLVATAIAGGQPAG